MTVHVTGAVHVTVRANAQVHLTVQKTFYTNQADALAYANRLAETHARGSQQSEATPEAAGGITGGIMFNSLSVFKSVTMGPRSSSSTLTVVPFGTESVNMGLDIFCRCVITLIHTLLRCHFSCRVYSFRFCSAMAVKAESLMHQGVLCEAQVSGLVLALCEARVRGTV